MFRLALSCSTVPAANSFSRTSALTRCHSSRPATVPTEYIIRFLYSVPLLRNLDHLADIACQQIAKSVRVCGKDSSVVPEN